MVDADGMKLRIASAAAAPRARPDMLAARHCRRRVRRAIAKSDFGGRGAQQCGTQTELSPVCRGLRPAAAGLPAVLSARARATARDAAAARWSAARDGSEGGGAARRGGWATAAGPARRWSRYTRARSPYCAKEPRPLLAGTRVTLYNDRVVWARPFEEDDDVEGSSIRARSYRYCDFLAVTDICRRTCSVVPSPPW
jgi:hypothetical protein